MANLVTVVIAFVSITTAAIDSHPGTSIGRNYLPAKLDHGPSFAKAFNTRSAATYRRFRARRSPTVGQSWASDFGRFPWMNRFDQDEGSGSEDLEPTPVNQFFDDRLQSADFDTSQQVTTSARSSPVELARSSSPVALAMSTTTMRTVIHVELNSSPTPSHRGRSTLRPVVSESLTEIVTNSKHQRVTTLPLTRLVVTHSPGGDADNSSDIGKKNNWAVYSGTIAQCSH